MLAHSVAASLLGTTPHTDTRASATLLPKPSTSDTLPLATPSARTSSGRPTTSIPSASSGMSPSHHRCPPPSGSILPPLYKETEVAHSYRRQCVAFLLTGSEPSVFTRQGSWADRLAEGWRSWQESILPVLLVLTPSARGGMHASSDGVVPRRLPAYRTGHATGADAAHVGGSTGAAG